MFDDFFSIVFIGAGIYLLYAARELKQAHRIIDTVITVPKEYEKKCKDMDGLVRYMFPRMMALACVTVLVGVYELMMNYSSMGDVAAFSILELVLYVVFFIVIIYYFVCVKKLEKMFY